MTGNKIKISKDLSLPIEAVTQTFGFIARKGGGKTYAAGVMVEELLRIGAQTIVLDPVGNWWGLRLDKDGKGRGFDIPVIGGLHGDIPIEAGAGALIADLIIEKNLSAVVDVSQLTHAEFKRFVGDFATQILQRKKRIPSPIHIVFEEAHLIAPQKLQKGEERMAGAVERIVRLGRNYGIGGTLISQRPQSINKNVLNQVEALFVFQLNGAHERKAIEQWVVDNGINIKEMVAALPSLPVGEGFIWSPQWLNILKRIKIGKKKTFDGSATPNFGTKSIEPRGLKSSELKEINEAMHLVVEKAAANDPLKLKREIQNLKMELAKALNATFTPEQAEALRSEGAEMEGVRLIRLQRKFSKGIESLIDLSSKMESVLKNELRKEVLDFIYKSPEPEISIAQARPDIKTPIPNNGAALTKGALKIINVLVQFHPRQLSKKQLGTVAGYSSTSGGFNSNLSLLRKMGLMGGNDRGFEPTEQALLDYGNGETIPTNPRDLIEFWKKRLPLASQKVLDVLVDIYPGSTGKERIAVETGYSQTSGGFNSAISNLIKNNLITKSPAGYRASETLYAGEK